MASVDTSLDSILAQIGDFGKYQSFVFSLVCVAVTLHSAVHVAFVFTAQDLDYRCKIPECENTTEFEPAWVKNAIPYTSEGPSKCTRFIHKNDSSSCEKSGEFFADTQSCQEFVYKTDDDSILKSYEDLHCHENLWKLPMVGTINNVGQFFGLFLSGLISDRWGRKVALTFGLFLCGICGLLRTFAPTYTWFLILEFLDACFGAGTYACGFIMGVELVGPKKRILTGTIICSCYALGEIYVAGAAWLLKDWKCLIYVVYAPTIPIIVYLWILPESIRWNLSKGNIERAKKTLLTVAKVNGKEISSVALEKLCLAEEEELQQEKPKHTLWEVCKSTILVLRLVNCCFCWITCAFLFYGLTLNSVSLSGSHYMDFMLTALIEIPSYFTCGYVVNTLGRKWSLSGSFFLTAVACLVFLVIPVDSHYGKLAVYLLGKFGATAAFTIMYVITSELFPTPLRHSLMGICSTFARIGSMVSPQTPLLEQIWKPLPIVTFSVMSIISGLLSSLFPETLNLRLPDTIQEAEGIGKSSRATKDSKLPKIT